MVLVMTEGMWHVPGVVVMVVWHDDDDGWHCMAVFLQLQRGGQHLGGLTWWFDMV